MNKRITKKKLKRLEKENMKGIELGNLVFGNSIDWQDDFVSFLHKCGLDSMGMRMMVIWNIIKLIPQGVVLRMIYLE
jgi:hypothetical protein